MKVRADQENEKHINNGVSPEKVRAAVEKLKAEGVNEKAARKVGRI